MSTGEASSGEFYYDYIQSRILFPTETSQIHKSKADENTWMVVSKLYI